MARGESGNRALAEKYVVETAPDDVDEADCFDDAKHLHEPLGHKLEADHHGTDDTGVDEVGLEELAAGLLIEDHGQVVEKGPVTFHCHASASRKKPAGDSTHNESEKLEIAEP